MLGRLDDYLRLALIAGRWPEPAARLNEQGVDVREAMSEYLTFGNTVRTSDDCTTGVSKSHILYVRVTEGMELIMADVYEHIAISIGSIRNLGLYNHC